MCPVVLLRFRLNLSARTLLTSVLVRKQQSLSFFHACSVATTAAVVKAARLLAAQTALLKADAANAHLQRLSSSMPRAELVRCSADKRSFRHHIQAWPEQLAIGS